MVRVAVTIPDHLARQIEAAASGDLSIWLTEAARRRLADAIAAGEAEMTGPVVRAVLDDGHRKRFEAEFRVALAGMSHSFDVGQLAEVVRRWWVTAGGDTATAEQDRAATARAAGLAERHRGDPRPAHLPHTVVNRTGPAVWAALDEPARVEFQTQFNQALIEAATAYDHQPPYHVVARWWPVAVLKANPDIQHEINDARQRIEEGDPTILGATTAYPHARPAA